MKPLASERLLLRDWSPDDVDFVFDLYSRWEVQRYLGRTSAVMTQRSAAEQAVERLRGMDHPVHGVWAVERTADRQLVGAGLLKPIPASGEELQPSDDIEVGWHLHPDAWGHGYATEVGARLLQHAFDSGLAEVVAVTNPDNLASQAVARRIGMIHRGRTERYYNTNCELFTSAAPPAQ